MTPALTCKQQPMQPAPCNTQAPPPLTTLPPCTPPSRNPLVFPRSRNVAQYWRNPAYNGVRYVFCVVLALLLGSIYWDMGMKRHTPTELLNVLGCMY